MSARGKRHKVKRMFLGFARQIHEKLDGIGTAKKTKPRFEISAASMIPPERVRHHPRQSHVSEDTILYFHKPWRTMNPELPTLQDGREKLERLKERLASTSSQILSQVQNQAYATADPSLTTTTTDEGRLSSHMDISSLIPVDDYRDLEYEGRGSRITDTSALRTWQDVPQKSSRPAARKGEHQRTELQYKRLTVGTNEWLDLTDEFWKGIESVENKGSAQDLSRNQNERLTVGTQAWHNLTDEVLGELILRGTA